MFDEIFDYIEDSNTYQIVTNTTGTMANVTRGMLLQSEQDLEIKEKVLSEIKGNSAKVQEIVSLQVDNFIDKQKLVNQRLARRLNKGLAKVEAKKVEDVKDVKDLTKAELQAQIKELQAQVKTAK
jgi:hypothetical protein